MGDTAGAAGPSLLAQPPSPTFSPFLFPCSQLAATSGSHNKTCKLSWRLPARMLGAIPHRTPPGVPARSHSPSMATLTHSPQPRTPNLGLVPSLGTSHPLQVTAGKSLPRQVLPRQVTVISSVPNSQPILSFPFQRQEKREALFQPHRLSFLVASLSPRRVSRAQWVRVSLCFL